jgi:NADH/NAD ratio-sensing transcriptional regulator Rex
MINKQVSDAVIKRLPRYRRILRDLIKKDIKVKDNDCFTVFPLI